jgi:hypothetical protein
VAAAKQKWQRAKAQHSRSILLENSGGRSHHGAQSPIDGGFILETMSQKIDLVEEFKLENGNASSIFLVASAYKSTISAISCSVASRFEN